MATPSTAGHLVRWFWLIILTTAVAVAGAFVLTMAQPDEYTSESMVMVGSLSETDFQQQLGFQQVSETMATLATTPLILTPVASELGFGDDLEELASRVIATSPGENSILRIEAIGSNPAEAQALSAAISRQLVTLIPVDPERPLRAVVVQPASMPEDPSSPRVVLNVGIAAMIGLTIGLVLVMAIGNARSKRPEGQAAPPGYAAPGGQWSDTRDAWRGPPR